MPEEKQSRKTFAELDGDDLWLAEMAMDTLIEYTTADTKPRKRFISCVLLPQFEGFANASQELCDAVADEVERRWLEQHADNASNDAQTLNFKQEQ